MDRIAAGSFDALKIGSFRILFAGSIASFSGFFMSTALQSVVAFDLTGTNTAVGSAVFGQGIGMFLFGPVGGAYADRLPKRRVVAIGQAISGSVFATLGFLYAIEELRLIHLVAGSFTVGCAFGMLGPARQALAIDLVPESKRGNAMALSNVANTLSRVMGPFLTGLILAYAWAGPAVAFAAIAALYLLSALSLVLIPKSVVRDNVGDTHVLQDLSLGIRYVRSHRRLRTFLLFFVTVMLIGFPHVTLIPGLLENELGREAREVTNFYLAAAIGALIASVSVARYADSPKAPLLFSLMAVGFGATLTCLALAPGYLSAVASILLVGATSGGFHALNGAVIARETDIVYMGRVMSLALLAFAGFGLSALPIAAIADHVGERSVLVGMGAAVVLIGAWRSAVEWRAEKQVGDAKASDEEVATV